MNCNCAHITHTRLLVLQCIGIGSTAVANGTGMFCSLANYYEYIMMFVSSLTESPS